MGDVKMLINVDEYMQHLQNELPDYNFTGIEKIEDYKEGSEIYEVTFKKEHEEIEKEYSYRMIAGYLGFSDKQLKENFAFVARSTFKAKNKIDKQEDEEKEKK